MLGKWSLRLPWITSGRVTSEAQSNERTGGPDNDSPYVTVYEAASLPEAHIVRGRLETEDIPAILNYESVGTVLGLVGGTLGTVDVQVPRALEEQAIQILESDHEGNQVSQ